MNNRLFLACSLLFVIFLSACKSDSTSSNNNSSSGPFTARVAGNAWNPTSSSVINAFGTLQVEGSTSTDALQIGLPSDTGTYTLGGFFSQATAMYTLTAGPKSYNASSGTLHFTQKTSSHVKGTFSFTGQNTASDTIVVSNGQFDIDYH